MRLLIHAACGKTIIPYVRRHLTQARKIIPRCHLMELSMALVGDAAMSRLHEQYMGLAGPTDVLSFELDHDSRGRVIGGEVVICVPHARRAAGAEVEKEVLLYALHGMLHLSGHDDRTDAGFTAMHRAEDRILSRLGVGKIFSSPRLGVG